MKRSDALARLEGKGKRPALAPISQNFMSMSDDEGDDEMSSSDSDISDDDSFIELPPSIIRRHAHSNSSPTILTTTSPSFLSSKSRSISSRSSDEVGTLSISDSVILP